MTETGEPLLPPGPPESAGPQGNPWERRATLGFAEGFIQSLKLFATAPTEAFAQTLKRGDFGSPLLFAILVGWIGIAVGQIWEVLMGASVLSMMPAEVRSYVPFVPGSTLSFLVSVIFAPVYIIIGLFIWSAIMHLCLVIVGGLGKSAAGFEGTFRVVSYATVAQLANLIPVLGGPLSIVWSMVLAIIGLQKLHDTSTGKAVAAVLIPFLLCCACIGAMIAFFGVGMLAMFANQ
jgi:hypothetical protein